jgi:DNA-binding transcriptional LysR family regulator
VWEIGRDALVALKEGKIDLAIADSWTLKDCQCTEVLFDETFTYLARSDRPRIRGELTLAIQWLRGELRSICGEWDRSSA